MDTFDPRAPLAGAPGVTPRTPHAAGVSAPSQAVRVWRYALSADRRWALLVDGQGRNLAEVHRPVLAAGPEGRLLTFEQVVRLMCGAPQLRALLQEGVEAGEAGGAPAGWLERARALLAELG